MIVAPGDVNRAGNDEKVFGAEIVRGLGHFAGEFEAAIAFCGIVARERVWPEKE